MLKKTVTLEEAAVLAQAWGPKQSAVQIRAAVLGQSAVRAWAAWEAAWADLAAGLGPAATGLEMSAAA